jgi:hypothetical protein
MSHEWTDLKDLQAVADAQAAGWEIQFQSAGTWIKWEANYWSKGTTYRGRPKQQAVVYECYDVDGKLVWVKPPIVPIGDRWTRIPQFDKIVEAAE